MIRSHRLPSALTLVAVTALTLTACGGTKSGGSVKPSPPDTTTVRPCAPDGAPGCSGPPPPRPGKTVTVTVQGGYQYQVSATPAVTATTEAAGGLSPQNAPPGKAFLQTTLMVRNATDRQEPLDAFASPTGGVNGLAAVLAIPMVNAGSFGVACAAVSQPGSHAPGLYSAEQVVPRGYCVLNTEISSISGPNSDAIGTVEMNPGDTETVVVYAAEQLDQGSPPLQDVAVFAGNQAPGQQLLGPTAPALVGSSGVPIFLNGVGQVLFFARGPIQTAPDPTATAGGVQLVAHVTITNPTPESVDISPLFTSGITGSASNGLSFTAPTADVAALGVDPSGCATICTFSAYVPSSTTGTIAPGASETIEIDGRADAQRLGGGFPATAPLQNVKVVYTDTLPPQLSTEIPQQAG